MSEPLLDVTFEATPADFVAFAEHVANEGEFYRAQMRSTRGLVLAILLVASLLAALVLTPDGNPFTMLAILSVGCAVAVSMWFAWPGIWRRQLRRATHRQAGMENPLLISGTKRYILDHTSVRYSGAYSGGYVTWPAVMRVTTGEQALYLHVSQASAHILPKRAFASEEDYTAAVQLATRLHADTSGHRAQASGQRAGGH